MKINLANILKDSGINLSFKERTVINGGGWRETVAFIESIGKENKTIDTDAFDNKLSLVLNYNNIKSFGYGINRREFIRENKSEYTEANSYLENAMKCALKYESSADHSALETKVNSLLYEPKDYMLGMSLMELDKTSFN